MSVSSGDAERCRRASPVSRCGSGCRSRRSSSPAATTQIIASVPAAPLPRIVLTSGANAGQSFSLHQGELIIGREEGSEIQLGDHTVSHNHALLRVHDDHVTIEDLHSTNGTRVNGTPVERPAPLAPGDQIDVGGVRLVVEPG